MRVKTFISIGLMSLLMLCAVPVYANGIPTLPHAFRGTVTINDDPALDGTQISATVAEGEVLTTSQNPIATVNDNYGIAGLHLLVQGYGLSGAITFYVNGVEVEGVTATFEAGGGPTLRDLDLVLEPGITAQKVVTVAAGQTNYEIDFRAEAGTTITVDTKTDEGEVTITVKKYAENPTGVALPADMLPIFIDISVDNPDAVDWPLRVEYTYTDAEVDAAGLDESILVAYYFKAAAWHECSDTGVTTATKTIWANMTRDELSLCPVAFGEAVAVEPEPEPEPEPTPEPTPGGGGGGAPVTPPPPGIVIDLSTLVAVDGVFTRNVTIYTADRLVQLIIDRGTKALTEDRFPLSEISIMSMDEPPFDPPEGAVFIGQVYDIGPDGATFSPAITLAIQYDPEDLPEDCAEKDLCITYWDGEKCCDLESTCDVEADTVSCPLSHFTIFAVIGTIPPPAPAPAAFSVSELFLLPAEVQPEEAVTIIVSVANTGGTEGTYSVVLKINEVKEAEKSVTIAAGESQDVSFSVTREELGSYSVDVDGLSGSFTVVAPLPVPAPPPAPPPVKPIINWLLISGIIAGVVVVGLLVFFLVRRRKAY